VESGSPKSDVADACLAQVTIQRIDDVFLEDRVDPALRAVDGENATGRLCSPGA
jgi:hypothetical protein